MNLEAQARYAARAAELKALGGLAPARAAALSRLALKTVVKVGVFFFFFFEGAERERKKREQQQLSRLSVASPALFRGSNCFVRGPEALLISRALSNETSKAFYPANSGLEKKAHHHRKNHHDEHPIVDHQKIVSTGGARPARGRRRVLPGPGHVQPVCYRREEPGEGEGDGGGGVTRAKFHRRRRCRRPID